MGPYISFVICGRNDKHGGNFIQRLQIFINALLDLSQRYDLDMELIIVEWNPPKDASRFIDILKLPKHSKSNIVRIIEVPNNIHNSFPNSNKNPFFQFRAKNVGIRRARGDYILVTNADILFNVELIKFLSLKSLSIDRFYRLNRYDVPKSIPINIPPEEQLEYCAKHAFRVLMNNGVIWLKFFPHIKYLFFSIFFRIRNFLNFISKNSQRTNKQVKKPFALEKKLHLRAAGDFFLMAKEHWEKIRGYPQLESYLHIDEYPCFMADTLGLKQFVLKDPLRIYHIEHSRFNIFKKPSIPYQKVLDDARKMQQSGKLIFYNGLDWGLENEKLPEYSMKI